MMSKILHRNTFVEALPELHFFEGSWDGVESNPRVDIEQAVQLGAQLLCRIRRERNPKAETLAGFSAEVHGILAKSGKQELTGFDVYELVIRDVIGDREAQRHCDQTPRNLYLLDALFEAFPKSQAIIMIRDPRAVMLSQKMKWKGKFVGPEKSVIPFSERVRRWANYHPIITSSLWKAGVKAGNRVQSESRVRVQSFEQLLENPEKEIKELCSFLNLKFSSEMLDVEGSLSPTQSSGIPDRGIDPTVKDRWRDKLSPVEIYWSERVNGEQMQALGYSLTGVPPTILSQVAMYFMLPFKVGLAFALNLSQMARFAAAFKRRFCR